jgi:aminoglycoside 6-adenylyltransferase
MGRRLPLRLPKPGLSLIKKIMRSEKQVLSQFCKWAIGTDSVRAAMLTGSRVEPGKSIDSLSDYDIAMYVKDLTSYKDSDSWLNNFGSIMVRWPFIPQSTFDRNWLTRLVLYKDGTRIDFQITDRTNTNPDSYENGYKVLVDKDNILTALNRPTFSKFVIKKPTEKEYIALTNEFWWDVTYVPKYLWRDELPVAKYTLDYVIHFVYLQQIVEWYIGLKNGWSVETGSHGKFFKQYLDDDTWSEYQTTFAGSDKNENWLAFLRSLEFFRKISTFIGKHLNYDYPEKVDNEVTEYCINIRNQTFRR